MTITLGGVTICSDAARSTAGSPVGPDNLQGNMTPGVVDREYIGADGIEPAQVGLDRAACSFGVVRTFGTSELALTWVSDNLATHGALFGELKFGSKTMMTNAAVRNLGYAVVGCTVALTYSIEGY